VTLASLVEGIHENGETSEVTLVPSWKRDGAGEGRERRGPQRGTAGREEQDPEGRTPWMLGGRRIVSRREPCLWPNRLRGWRDGTGAGLRARVVFLDLVFEITDREQTVERVLKP
jgi:hypothetical protein